MSNCKYNFTEEAEFNPSFRFTDYPPYLCDPVDLNALGGVALGISDKLLIHQYKNSPLFKHYLEAFTIQIDRLMEETKKVELGRFIQSAAGTQLDVIGIILQQSRNIAVVNPEVWFGFQGDPAAAKMADEVVPTDGGEFFDESSLGFETRPLSDSEYRRVLLCRGYCITQSTMSINNVYEAIEIALGFTPDVIEIQELGANISITLDSSSVVTSDLDILDNIKGWFIPMTFGLTYNILNII